MRKSCVIPFAIFVVLVISFFIYLRFREGVTSLMIAARSGNDQQVARLIRNGADIDRQSIYGWTALMFACWQGHEKCVRVLLDAGADPNINSVEIPARFETTLGHPPSTALREAISNDYPSIARLLVSAKAKIDPLAVAMAAHGGHLDLLKLFKEKGVEINEPSGNAFYPSPLIAASEKGELVTIKWLVEQGADPNRIVDRHNALIEAIENDHPEVVQFLLEKGANPNLECGLTEGTSSGALFAAVTKVTHDHAYMENISIVKLLLDHGADINQRGFGGKYSTFEFLKSKIENGEMGLRNADSNESRKMELESLAHLKTVQKMLFSHRDRKE